LNIAVPQGFAYFANKIVYLKEYVEVVTSEEINGERESD